MNKLDALKELASKVEAGKWWEDVGIASAACAKVGLPGRPCTRAFHGSLDAAKALHDAVLPGWAAVVDMVSGEIGIHQQILWDDGQPTDEWEWMFEVDGSSDNPARAWLLAILRALIAQEASP